MLTLAGVAQILHKYSICVFHSKKFASFSVGLTQLPSYPMLLHYKTKHTINVGTEAQTFMSSILCFHLCAFQGVIFSISLDANGSRVCTASDDRSVRVWQLSTLDTGLTSQCRWDMTHAQLIFSFLLHTLKHVCATYTHCCGCVVGLGSVCSLKCTAHRSVTYCTHCLPWSFMFLRMHVSGWQNLGRCYFVVCIRAVWWWEFGLLLNCTFSIPIWFGFAELLCMATLPASGKRYL